MQPNHIMKLPLFDAVVMTEDRTSTAINVNEIVTLAVQATWTGTSPVGSLVLQASNDGTTYVDVNSQSVSGNSGSIMWNVERPGWGFVRLFFDWTSGTGSLSANINGKRN